MNLPSYANVTRHAANVQRMNEGLHGAAVKLATTGAPEAGRKLGHSTSHAKAQAAQRNGAKGGRPVGS